VQLVSDFGNNNGLCPGRGGTAALAWTGSVKISDA